MSTKWQIIKAPFKIGFALIKFLYVFLYRLVVVILLMAILAVAILKFIGLTMIFFTKGSYKVTTKAGGIVVDNIAKPAVEGMVEVADRLDKSSDKFEQATFKSRGKDMFKAAWRGALGGSDSAFNKMKYRLTRKVIDAKNGIVELTPRETK